MSGPRVRQDGLNPLKSSSAIIPARVLKPVSPTNVWEQQFIAGSPQDQPKRAELNGFKKSWSITKHLHIACMIS